MFITNYEIMVVDLQGSGHMLYDPEIASTKLTKGKEILFCAGNIETDAVSGFISAHSCNDFCKLLDFKPLNVDNTCMRQKKLKYVQVMLSIIYYQY